MTEHFSAYADGELRDQLEKYWAMLKLQGPIDSRRMSIEAEWRISYWDD
jgi:hypothetical protein